MGRVVPIFLCLLCVHCTLVTSILTSDLDASIEGADAIAGDAAVLSDAGAPDAVPCPASYQAVAGTCHRQGTVAQSWFLAQEDCVQDGVGAHLVIVDDEVEQAALVGDVWIGLYEFDGTAVFRTVTNVPPPFIRWATDQPMAGGGLCAENRTEGWHDDGCDKDKMYVCEFDGVAADTPYLP